MHLIISVRNFITEALASLWSSEQAAMAQHMMGLAMALCRKGTGDLWMNLEVRHRTFAEELGDTRRLHLFFSLIKTRTKQDTFLGCACHISILLLHSFHSRHMGQSYAIFVSPTQQPCELAALQLEAWQSIHRSSLNGPSLHITCSGNLN